MTRQSFTAGSFGLRLMGALLLVFCTYNAGGLSYLHWVLGDGQGMVALKVLAGLALLIGWVVFVRATMNSLGGLGFLLAAGFFGALIWLFADWGILPSAGREAVITLTEFALAAVLATGMSWSHIRRRLSGQVDTDEIEG
jgi:hypothetical protein